MRIVAYTCYDPLLEECPAPFPDEWRVAHTYQDITLEPSQDANRPQWQQLLQDSQTEPIDGVLVRRLEDLGDTLAEVRDRLAELQIRRIRLAIAESFHPADFANQPDDRANQALQQTELLTLLQTLQANQRSRQIQQGHARNRVKALPPPGKAPYGYRRGKSSYVLDRAAAPVVKEFFEHFLLYGSVRGAVRYLAKKYSKRISASTGHRWLTNPVYRGDLEYQNGDVVPDAHTPILSRDEAAQIDRLLRRNRRLPPRTASAPRSLAGLVVCGECQCPFNVTRVSRPRQKQDYLYLRPGNCPHKPACRTVPYEGVLQQTIERICTDLPKAVAGMALPEMEGVKQGISGAIAGKQAILEQLPALVSSGVLDPATADLRAYGLRTEMAQLQQKLAALPPVNLKETAQTVSIPQFWQDLSESERRFYFREFIRQIQLFRSGKEWQLKLVFIF